MQPRDAAAAARDQLPARFGCGEQRVDASGQVMGFARTERPPGVTDGLAHGGDVGAQHGHAGGPCFEEDDPERFPLRRQNEQVGGGEERGLRLLGQRGEVDDAVGPLAFDQLPVPRRAGAGDDECRPRPRREPRERREEHLQALVHRLAAEEAEQRSVSGNAEGGAHGVARHARRRRDGRIDGGGRDHDARRGHAAILQRRGLGRREHDDGIVAAQQPVHEAVLEPRVARMEVRCQHDRAPGGTGREPSDVRVRPGKAVDVDDVGVPSAGE